MEKIKNIVICLLVIVIMIFLFYIVKYKYFEQNVISLGEIDSLIEEEALDGWRYSALHGRKGPSRTYLWTHISGGGLSVIWKDKGKEYETGYHDPDIEHLAYTFEKANGDTFVIIFQREKQENTDR